MIAAAPFTASLIDLSYTNPPIRVVRIPAGKVILGTSERQAITLEGDADWPRDERADHFFREEQPQHTIFVAAFGIGLTTVTNSQYLSYVLDSGDSFPNLWPGLTFPEGQSDYPVSAVSWLDALRFCHWLSSVSRLHCRLPTEAEWERAARGNDDRFYPWGNDFNPYRANTSDSFTKGTTPVMLHSPASDSAFGVVGMSGNVWEWTSSLFEPYPYDPTDGREDLTKRGARIVRGGAWMYSHRLARCSAREGNPPDAHLPAIGFRIAVDLPL